MKRKLLFVLSLVTSATSFAQITINANDVIGFGEFIERTYDTIPAIAHGPAGVNQTWNYGALLNAHTTENFGFGAASWYAGNTEFPDANLGINDAASNSTVFVRKNVDALDIMGVYGDLFGTGSDEALVFDPFDRLITFPSTYETEFFNTYTFDLTLDGAAFGVDSIVANNTTDKTSTFDAWGSVTTPFGTFDVIRQYVYEYSSTEIDAYLFGTSVFNDVIVEETHTYYFWTNDAGSRYAVLEYTYDPIADMVTEAIWQSSAPVLALEEEGLPVSSLNVFPNPTSELLTIEVDGLGAHNFEIVDGLGRTALKGNMEGNVTAISVAALENGIYTVRLTNNTTNQVTVQRFVVQK
jgi:hypothetical protein